MPKPFIAVPLGVNRLLAALPNREYADVLPHLELMALRRGTILHRQGDPSDYVYFPGSGLCSLAHTLPNGEGAVVATVGNHGVVAPSLLSRGLSVTSTVVQVADTLGLRMSQGAFGMVMHKRGAFFDAMTRFSLGLVESITRTAACHRLHPVQRRLPRWLLQARDRLDTTEIPLTHDALALMLGTRRATVTVTLGTLQSRGLIRCHHGRVVILDALELERVACDCYLFDKALFHDLFPARGPNQWPTISAAVISPLVGERAH